MLFQYPDSLSELCIATEELLPLNLEGMEMTMVYNSVSLSW